MISSEDEVFEAQFKIFVRSFEKFNRWYFERLAQISENIFENCKSFTYMKLSQLALCKKCPYSELFWPAFSRIRTEYGENMRECGKIRIRITPNTDIFTQCNRCSFGQYFQEILFIIWRTGS